MKAKPHVLVCKIDNEIFFNGFAKEDEMCPTVGQFLKYIDNHITHSEEDKKILALHHLKGVAKEFTKFHNNKNWKLLKQQLFEHFKCKLTLKEKIELRRHLLQRENESCKEFYARCVKWQFFLNDDQIDSVFERDILINFVSGLREEIYQKLVFDNGISNLDYCLNLATKIEQDIFLSGNIEVKIKVELDPNNFVQDEYKNETDNHQIKLDAIKSFDENLDEIINDNTNNDIKDDYSSSDNDAGSDFELSKEDFEVAKIENPFRFRTSKVSTFPCTLCSKTFKSELVLQKHLVKEHKQKIDEKFIQCQYCDEICRKKHLNGHILRKHPSKINKDNPNNPILHPLFCELCPKIKGKIRVNFNKSNCNGELSLALHKSLHKHFELDPNDSTKLLCQICHQYFTKNGLERHIKLEHFNVKEAQEYGCKNCGRVLKDKIRYVLLIRCQ